MEIERKWMVNGWPEGENFPALPLKEEFAMRQGYISVRPTVRIREEALEGGKTGLYPLLQVRKRACTGGDRAPHRQETV